ncbi:MAG: glycosyltransferase family 39 protein [Anaerolineaceae bacterium]|nr:glycosyltransferase family 39 protein [Anaerolineaceae bacterium]
MATPTLRQPAPTRLPAWWPAVIALLFAFGVLVFGIYRVHMRPDEGYAFTNYQWSFERSITRLALEDNQAQLWGTNIWVWERLVGTHEVPVRMNSILWSMLSLAITYQIAKSWFKERRTDKNRRRDKGRLIGTYAIILLSVNAFFFIYSLEMRMYALAMLTSVLSMRFFSLWLQKQKWYLAVMYGLSVPLMLYTHYYLGFIVLVQIIYFVLRHGLNWRLWLQAIGAALVAIIVWFPGMLIIYHQFARIDFGDAGGLKIPTSPTNLQTINELLRVVTNGYWFIFIPLMLLAIWRWWRRGGLWLAMLWGIGVPALVLLVNTQSTIFTQRYVSFLIVGLGLVFAAGLAALPRRLGWVALIVIVPLCYNSVTSHITDRIPFRDIYTQMAEASEPDDLILVQHGPDYFKKEMMERYLPDYLLDDNLVYDVADTVGHRRVWHITHEFLTLPVRDTFEALREDREVMYVTPASSCTRAWCYVAQLLVAPPQAEATLFGDQIGFRGVDVDSITDDAVTLHLWWENADVVDRDYSISVQILDSSGALVAQADGPITSYFNGGEQIATIDMVPDTNYIDVRTLDVSDVPPGEYTLELIVYWWEDNTRLTRADGSDHLVIESITLGE